MKEREKKIIFFLDKYGDYLERGGDYVRFHFYEHPVSLEPVIIDTINSKVDNNKYIQERTVNSIDELISEFQKKKYHIEKNCTPTEHFPENKIIIELPKFK